MIALCTERSPSSMLASVRRAASNGKVPAWTTDGRTSDDNPTARLSSDMGYLLWRAGKLAASAARVALQSLEVRPRQFVVLAFCDEQGPVSQKAICDALGLDPSAGVAVLDSLEQAGYVERHPDPHDRRVRLIFVTELGRTFRASCQREVDRAIERMLTDLGATERRQLQSLVTRVVLTNAPDAIPGQPVPDMVGTPDRPD